MVVCLKQFPPQTLKSLINLRRAAVDMMVMRVFQIRVVFKGSCAYVQGFICLLDSCCSSECAVRCARAEWASSILCQRAVRVPRVRRMSTAATQMNFCTVQVLQMEWLLMVRRSMALTIVEDQPHYDTHVAIAARPAPPGYQEISPSASHILSENTKQFTIVKPQELPVLQFHRTNAKVKPTPRMPPSNDGPASQ